MKSKAILIVCSILLMGLCSDCVPRYTLNGSSINYDIYKTVDIGSFPIRAALVYPPLQQLSLIHI